MQTIKPDVIFIIKDKFCLLKYSLIHTESIFLPENSQTEKIIQYKPAENYEVCAWDNIKLTSVLQAILSVRCSLHFVPED